MKWYGSINNRIMESGKNPDPVIGMGATLLMWTDRKPLTIIDVLKPNLIVLQADSAIRTDKNGMSESQSYDYRCNEQGNIYLAKKMKNSWRAIDSQSYRHSFSKGFATPIAIGYRSAYHDYSF